MIFSSADILQLLGGNSIIRAAASKIVIVDKKPLASGDEGFHVYIEKYPTEEEFQVTWNIWIESDGSEPDDILLAEMRRLLPGFKMKLGLLIEASVTEFKSENTETRPKPAAPAPAVMPPAGWMDGLERRVTELIEDVNDRMLLVQSGRAGKDGARGERGPMGPEGRPGRDMVATSATLDDLLDVEIGAKIPVAKGQVLTFDGVQWTNLYVPQLLSSTSGGGSSTSSGGTANGTAIQWKYHQGTGEPHSGDFHTDSAQTDLSTVIHVSKTNSANNSVDVLLSELLATSTKLYVSEVKDPSIAHLFQIDSYSETTAGYEINVTHIETAGPEVNFTAPLIYEFLFLGANGSGGGAIEINDLTDVDTGTIPPTPGQTLVWNGTDWVPGNFASGGGIADAPADGNYYVRYNGTWVNLIEAINMINLLSDAGNFTTGEATTANSYIYDGGDFLNNTSDTGEQVDPLGYGDTDGGYWS